MKWFENPPDWGEILKNNSQDFWEYFKAPETTSFINHVNDKYLYWDELKYRPLPKNLDKQIAWAFVKVSRMSQFRKINLHSKDGKLFWYWLPESILKELHFIDQNASGQILIDEPTLREADKERGTSLAR